MMALYVLYIMCVVLCTVHSYSIKGTIQHDNGAVSEVTVSNYIDGENWSHTRDLTLNRLTDANTLPTLTLANFESIQSLFLCNIALEHVPVFVNTSCKYIFISGNKFQNVPANAFSGPQPSKLYLRNNKMKSMANNSINIGASRVYLHCNKLDHFSQSWFEDPASVEYLNLRGNRFKYLQNRAFDQMTKLHWLELSYNQITSIGSECFSARITNLYLQFNDIAQLSLDMFADRDQPMEYLFLHHNQLSYVPEALLLRVKPRGISLVGNPWQCQCLQDIEKWLRELNSTRYDIPTRRGEPVCVVPLSFQYLCIAVADKELQQTYARALSPVQGCWASPCHCKAEESFLTRLT